LLTHLWFEGDFHITILLHAIADFGREGHQREWYSIGLGVCRGASTARPDGNNAFIGRPSGTPTYRIEFSSSLSLFQESLQLRMLQANTLSL